MLKVWQRTESQHCTREWHQPSGHGAGLYRQHEATRRDDTVLRPDSAPALLIIRFAASWKGIR
jgi:hypothetical protein